MKIFIKKFVLKYASPLFRLIGPSSRHIKLPKNADTYRVLVVGVVLANKENYFNHIISTLANSSHNVCQYWVSLFGSVSTNLKNVHVEEFTSAKPRNEIINYLINKADISKFDFVIVCDDDIKLPKYFLDKYLYIQHKLNFSIAQPARTNFSYISHGITRRRFWLIARKTLFVEIGPLVSFEKDIFDYIFPFDEKSAMGWGLDYVWPVILQSNHKNMGVIDATPVDHSLRETAKSYSEDKANTELDLFLLNNTHLEKSKAQINLKSYYKIDK